MSYIRSLLIAILIVLPLVNCTSRMHTPRRGFSETVGASERGLWVTRWDFKTEDDVRRAIADAHTLGMTDVYWQVRGQGDAFYESSYEPWGHEIAGASGQGPGFDPLEVAVQEARIRGVRIHAWFNVMPLWKGVAQPKAPNHPWITNPSWRLQGVDGKPQPLSENYVIGDPTDPQWQAHVIRVIGDVAHRYRIDGVHLDYIRFLTDEVGESVLKPGDPASLERYAKSRRLRSVDSTTVDRKDHRDWVRSEITDLVRRISNEARGARRGIRMSAAVWRNPDLARERYLQDATAWVQNGYLDVVMPMIYTKDDSAYRRDLTAWYEQTPRDRVIPGIGIYMHDDPGQTLGQISTSQAGRYALFAYGSLFESANPGEKGDARTQAQRERRRDAIEALNDRLILVQ